MKLRASNNSIRKREAREREALDKFILEVVNEFFDDLYHSQFFEWSEYADIFHQYKVWYRDRAIHWNEVKKKDTIKADLDYFENAFKPLEKPFKHGNKFNFYGGFREFFKLD